MAITDEEYESAARVIRRHYAEWVRSTAEDLIKESFDFEGRDDLQEAFDSTVDSAMTYTKDQLEVLFASEADGASEAANAGIETPTTSQLAYFMFQTDLMETLENDAIASQVLDDVSLEDRREAFLEAAHLFYKKDGKSYFYVGVLNEGQNDEIDFGVLIVDAKDDWSFVGIQGIANGKYGFDLRAAWDEYHANGKANPHFLKGLGAREIVHGDVEGTDNEVAKALERYGFPVVSCGLNADWNSRAWSLGPGRANVTDGGYYLLDTEEPEYGQDENPIGQFVIVQRFHEEPNDRIDEVIPAGDLYGVLEIAKETLDR